MAHSDLVGEVINRNGLIPGDASKKILNMIKSGSIDNNDLSLYGLLNSEIQHLKELYEAKIKQIPMSDDQPRYLHFYHILQDKMPQITWEMKRGKNGKAIVNFVLPLIENLQPSIASLLLDRVIVTNKQKLTYRYPFIQTKQENTEEIEALETFMLNTKAIYPKDAQMRRIISWIQNAQAGNAATIFMHTCPDYSAEITNDPIKRYRHTFEYLGSDIGHIARRIIDILPELKELLAKLKITPTIITAIADYEAFSEETIYKVGLTREEFLQKVDSSRKSFDNVCKKILPLQTVMFSELCGGEKYWLQKVEEIKQEFKNSNFGLTGANQNTFAKIAKHRKALYAKWFGEKENIQDYIPIAINQSAEYTAIGYYLNAKFQNCLVLGADSDDFGPFYSFYKATPTLYFKRFYC